MKHGIWFNLKLFEMNLYDWLLADAGYNRSLESLTIAGDSPEAGILSVEKNQP